MKYRCINIFNFKESHMTRATFVHDHWQWWRFSSC